MVKYNVLLSLHDGVFVMKRIILMALLAPNLGVINRCVRILLGCLLLDFAIAHQQLDGSVITWTLYVGWLSLYPIITGLLGIDYIHDLIGAKTCDISDRNWSRRLSYKINATISSNHHS